MAMTSRSEFIADLARDIAHEVGSESINGQAIKADLNMLSEQLVAVFATGRADFIGNAYECVERGYSEILAKTGLKDDDFSAIASAAELRAFTRILGSALQQNQKEPRLSEIVADNAYRPLLVELSAAPNGLSSQELATKLDMAPETVARKLPFLRSHSCVRSHQVGRRMINRVTSECQKLLPRALPAPKALPAPSTEGIWEAVATCLLGAKDGNPTVRAQRAAIFKGDKSESHGKVYAGKHFSHVPPHQAIVEVVATDHAMHVEPITEVLMNDGWVTGLCDINNMAGNQGAGAFFILMDPPGKKVTLLAGEVARHAGQAEDDDMLSFWGGA